MSKIAECQNCTYYKAFYRKGIFGFWEERQGLCSKCSPNMVEEQDTCENWKRYEGTAVTIKALDSVIEDIKVLIKIYKKNNYTF